MMGEREASQHLNGFETAVIGMAGRFPGARNTEEFWRNLRDGVESISFFSDEDLASVGVDHALLNDPNYVRAKGIIEDAELFDASFFGYTPREAEVTDPQQRVFLECAWEALENAGYAAGTGRAAPLQVGVYAGVSMNSYMLNNIYPNRKLVEAVGGLQMRIAGEKDFLATRVSYKLDLRGPAVVIQASCSTSLVAVHEACRSLLAGDCEMALAGGVTISVPQKIGHLYQAEGIASPDGHCRAFDAKAQGTVGGNGVGIVVLKRLADALSDGDCIHAVIKGTAINNDGSLKVGYTAPSVDGQADVITKALAMAEVSPETISYVETHGTGTALGDPIEVAALTQAFRAGTERKEFCALGSLKTNIGHLDAAAGVAGLIKTALALEHRMIPPSLHFERPNPKIAFTDSPFYVNAALAEWDSNGTPRRAGVSSFGIGGTNSHAVLEEAPPRRPSTESRPWQLLVLSTKTSAALKAATGNLLEFFNRHEDASLPDVAYTLQTGRKKFEHRRMLVCRDIGEARAKMETPDCKRVITDFQESGERPVVFMFPGQGSQHVRMAAELYGTEPVFREHVDRCCEILEPQLGVDLRDVFFPRGEKIEETTNQDGRAAARDLNQTLLAQPALFVIEYALAQLWMAWGVRPQAMIGHSVGEYVAACLAGVFSLEDGLKLVAARGRLIQALPGGAMLAVPLSRTEVETLLDEQLSVAAINAPSLCVASGPAYAVEKLESRLAERGVACRRLHTSHAFHSEMMEPALAMFREIVGRVELKAPMIPYVSNVTGTWITATDVTDPSYWTRHLRDTVHFAAGVEELLKERERVLLEVGPGRVLSTFVGRHPNKSAEHVVLSSMRHPEEQQSDVAFLLSSLGRLWLAGVEVDWSGFYARERRRRIPLPTYPFERQRYWIEPPKEASKKSATRDSSLRKNSEIADWFYFPSWRRTAPLLFSKSGWAAKPTARWLVFADRCELGARLAERLGQTGQDVFVVEAGSNFARLADRRYRLNPESSSDYGALIEELSAQGARPDRIIHLWGVEPDDQTASSLARLEKAQSRGFYSLLYLAQELSGSESAPAPVEITVVTGNAQEVIGSEALSPEKATSLGACKVIPQEYPFITCRHIDLDFRESGCFDENAVDQLLAELSSKTEDAVIAYRGKHRWAQTYEPVHVGETAAETPARLRKGGVYLITGGLGNIGLTLAEYVARTARAKLILTGRSAFPARQEWDQWLDAHDDTDRVSSQIRKLKELEELGAEVFVATADVADEQQMREVVARAEQQFGPVNGVVHAAAATGEDAFTAISGTTKGDCERHFRPKAHGLLVLEEVLRGRELDFCVLFSSLASVLGGLGFVAYAAANNFMDAFTQRRNQSDAVGWISVNWDGWRFREGNKEGARAATNLAELAITPEEGVECFRRILSSYKAGQLIVSTADLQTRLERSGKPERSREEDAARPQTDSQALHARPVLKSSYVAPRNDVEQKLAGIWGQALGIGQVGIHDNFFDLGGDSVLNIQIVSKASAAGLRLTPAQVFEHQTIAELAAVVTGATRMAGDEHGNGLRHHAVAPSAAESDRHTPSDFPAAKLSQTDLDKLLTKIGGSGGKR